MEIGPALVHAGAWRVRRNHLRSRYCRDLLTAHRLLRSEPLMVCQEIDDPLVIRRQRGHVKSFPVHRSREQSHLAATRKLAGRQVDRQNSDVRRALNG